jgi:hypothetical protein
MFKTSNLEELILGLRVQLGDTNPVPTYSDEFLHMVLREAVSTLMTRWNDKYYISETGVVTRSPSELFDYSSPPVIQYKDRRPIVLQASIMIKSGKKFNTSGEAVSWRDEEISYSNLESSRQLTSTLQDDLNELNSILPGGKGGKLLARPLMGRLYGEFPKEYE